MLPSAAICTTKRCGAPPLRAALLRTARGLAAPPPLPAMHRQRRPLQLPHAVSEPPELTSLSQDASSQSLDQPSPLPTPVFPPDGQHHKWCGREECSLAARAIAGLSSLPDVWAWAAQRYGDAPAIEDAHRKPHTTLTFRQLHDSIQQFAAGLAALGVRPGDRVALFAESSGRWLVADAGIQAAGAADAVRGVDSIPPEELSFILGASDAQALVVQDARTLKRLLPHLTARCTLAVVLWGDVPTQAVERNRPQLKTVGYDQLMEEGRRLPSRSPPPVGRQDLSSFAFTSGTTGKPKTVPMTHFNFISQLLALDFMPVEAGDLAVSYLPPWHAYGRTLDYYLLSRGCTLFYSRLRDLKQDLAEQQPQIFISVPLLLDNLHAKAMGLLQKSPGEVQLLEVAVSHVRARRVLDGTALEHALIPPTMAQQAAAAATAAMLAPVHQVADATVFERLREQLGFSRARVVVSGGGSLTPKIDDFYEAIGVPVVVGYGLTETSPVLTIRHLDSNVRLTIGPPLPRTSIRIGALGNKAQEVPDGQQGVIMASGPQVMSGYQNNPEATAKAFPLGKSPGNGWFDTGDLGWRVPHGVPGTRMGGNIVITGREKDTIVLLNGENGEPQPLEDLLCTSPHIQFAVLVGHARRALGALLVPTPEAVEQAGGDVDSPQLYQTIQGEVARTLEHRAPHERVRAFAVLSEPFSIEDGTLTRTMKPRRAAIFAKYAGHVEQVQKELLR